jgi:membrane-associated phospholipid phosphatase
MPWFTGTDLDGEGAPRRPVSGMVLGLVLLAVVFLLGLVVRGGPLPIDMALADGLAASFPPAATDLFNSLGELPVFGAAGLLGALVCLIQGRRPMAAAFILGLFVEVATTVVKLAIDRPRPPGGTDVEAFITAATYPSGHTVRIVVVAGLFVAAFAGRRGPARWLPIAAAVAVVVLVGCARIASHEHWPSDVVGGWLLGAAWLIGCLAVSRSLTPRCDRRQSRGGARARGSP